MGLSYTRAARLREEIAEERRAGDEAEAALRREAGGWPFEATRLRVLLHHVRQWYLTLLFRYIIMVLSWLTHYAQCVSLRVRLCGLHRGPKPRAKSSWKHHQVGLELPGSCLQTNACVYVARTPLHISCISLF